MKAPPSAVSELGVGCVTCHVVEEGVVLAAASGREGAPHPLRRSTDFARTGGCASCHEFGFPAAWGERDGEMMQTTVREHRRSISREQSCGDCHMPPVRGKRSHAFAEVRDPDWLRKNLRATVAWVEGNRVRLTLVQPAPGHGFPTGDLFRRLEVGFERRDAGGAVGRREVRYLGRHFQIVPGALQRRLVGNDRVFDGPEVVEVALSPAPGSAVSWWVSYQRVATTGAGVSPGEAQIESEVQLYSGTLLWETK